MRTKAEIFAYFQDLQNGPPDEDWPMPEDSSDAMTYFANWVLQEPGLPDVTRDEVGLCAARMRAK